MGQYHTVVVGGPLIDDQKNIYIASEDGFRKFGPGGKTMWYYHPPGRVAHCPSLMNGALFGSTTNGFVFALSMETGQPLWTVRPAQSIGGDTAYVESHDGVVVAGVEGGPSGDALAPQGSVRLHGLNATTGSSLWDYKSDAVLWNVMAQFPGDDSAIVMDEHGGVHKIGLHNGTLLWKASPPQQSLSSFSDGGVILGPDGTSYTCSNEAGNGQPGQPGALRAYALSDGRRLWERVLDYPCNSWPAVTADGASVVVPTGPFVANPSAFDLKLMLKMRKTPWEMHEYSLSLGADERSTFGMPNLPARIEAFNAQTGEPQWEHELEAYGRVAAAGDEEGSLERLGRLQRPSCLPAQFSAPTISGDGTVFVGRANGLLYGIRHSDSGPDAVQSFDAGAGFLHPGTAFAPGMMAITSCDGLFVWTE